MGAPALYVFSIPGSASDHRSPLNVKRDLKKMLRELGVYVGQHSRVGPHAPKFFLHLDKRGSLEGDDLQLPCHRRQHEQRVVRRTVGERSSRTLWRCERTQLAWLNGSVSLTGR